MKNDKLIIGFLTVFFGLGLLMVAHDSISKKRLEKRYVKMGNIIVDAAKKEIRITTRLAIKHGVLEFLLVGKNGRTYESVLKVDKSKPSDLHAALLLLGAKPVDIRKFQAAINEKKTSEEFFKKFPDSALIVEIKHKGRAIDMNKLIMSSENNNLNNAWVFTGSVFTKDQRYVADLGHTYISVWTDPVAVINLYSTHGNPYKGGLGFRMHGMHPWLENDPFEIVIKPYTHAGRINEKK